MKSTEREQRNSYFSHYLPRIYTRDSARRIRSWCSVRSGWRNVTQIFGSNSLNLLYPLRDCPTVCHDSRTWYREFRLTPGHGCRKNKFILIEFLRREKACCESGYENARDESTKFGNFAVNRRMVRGGTLRWYLSRGRGNIEREFSEIHRNLCIVLVDNNVGENESLTFVFDNYGGGSYNNASFHYATVVLVKRNLLFS